MTLTHEAFREQLVDYVYGELDGEPLRAFEAALAESAEYRAELEQMRATLRVARGGLAALREEPPARVRDALLAAERATRIVRPGPWARLRKSLPPVVIPSVALAAAVAFAVLSPPRDDVVSESQVARQTPSAQPFPGSPAPVSEPADDEAAPAPASEGAARTAEPSTEISTGKGEAAEAKRARAPADAYASSRGGSGGLGGAPAKRKAARDDSEARALRESVGESAAEEERSAPRSAQLAAAPQKRSMAREAPAAEVAAPVAAAPATADRSASDPAHAPTAQVERARELIEARRWSDAIIAYRELLQRYPQDTRAASWRSELGHASRELSALQIQP